MNTLNKKELVAAQNQLWEDRASFTQAEFAHANAELYARFEMRIEDLIECLQEIKKDKGNIRVLQEKLYSGTLHLVNLHVQQRNDTDDNEWILSIY